MEKLKFKLSVPLVAIADRLVKNLKELEFTGVEIKIKTDVPRSITIEIPIEQNGRNMTPDEIFQTGALLGLLEGLLEHHATPK